MLRALLLVCCVGWLGIGVASYVAMAGAQTDWSQLVTYIWLLFWPCVLLLGAFYESPVAFLMVAAAVIVGWRIVRRRK